MQEELIYDDLQPSEVASDIPVEEVTHAIEVTDVEAVQIDVDEAFPSFGEADALNHALLTNRELHDAHPITAITGLREELDSIEALQTLYSDKKGNADYYEWADGLALGENGVGYFVSLNQDVRTISICTGDDIFGVVVPSAAFIGGQDNVARDDHYGLVATTGAVHVRCELDVAVGDYVVSNTYGVATSTNSGHGYKVVALHDIDHAPYATINLNISADQVDVMGAKLQNLDARMDAAESNIISAINVAHEAYNKAGEMIIISGDASKKAQDALDTSNKVLDSVESLEDAALKSQQIAAQAKAIADGALVSAESIRKEAVDEANNALAEAAKLRDEFALMEEGINEVEDQIAIVAKKVNGKYTVVASWSEANKENDVVYYAEDTKLYWYYDSNIWKSTDDPSVAGLPMALSGLQVEVDEHSASINGLVDWRDGTNYAMARIEQKADANGAYIQSTVSNMNKYAVGPHSQAYGFTLEQAASVLEEGMMYVPTDDVTEEYEYAENDTVKVYQRSFTRGYLYRWGTPDGYPGGWITIDKNYSEAKLNTSAPAVYFATQPPSVSGNFGYWYTNGDNVAEGYEPYTLYKWDLPYKYQTQKDDGTIVDVEEYHWMAVATLAGNSQSRAVSQIRQNANSIESSVITLKGDYAGTKTWVDENKAAIQDVVTWKGQNADSITTFMQEAGDNFASAAQVAKIVDEDGNVKESAIVTAVNNNISSISLSADNIQFTGQKLNIKVDATNIDGTLTIGQLPNTVATTGDIPTEQGIVTIAKGAITADHIKTLGLEVGNQIKMGANATISWDNVGSKPIIPTNTNQLLNGAGFTTLGAVQQQGYQNADQVTTITKNTITTSYVNALNITAAEAEVAKKLTVGDIFSADASDNQVTIGGWNITSFELYNGHAGIYSGHSSDQSLIDGKLSPIRFYAGDPNRANAPFKVLNDGSLYASEAKISGEIIAKSGKIGAKTDGTGGWTIDQYGLSTGEFGQSGMHLYSSSKAGAGYFGASDNMSDTYHWMMGVGSHFGVTQDGSLYASSGRIGGWKITSSTLTRTITANDTGKPTWTLGEQIEVTHASYNTWLKFGWTIGSEKIGETIYPYYGLKTNSNLGFQPGTGRHGVLCDTWYIGELGSTTPIISDRNKKHSIQVLGEEYSRIFDRLNPVTFKYNDGTSDRIHTGFIAQDVEDAVLSAGLTTQEFAAVCYEIDENGNKLNYGVRYEEIVSMNTYEIQKLKARTAELEAKIAKLEARLID